MNDKKGADKALINPPERSGIDINFARFPVFASKAVRGYRVLPSRVDVVEGIKVTRTVSVGTYRGTDLSLDMDDELVFKAIYGRWERNGCDMEKRSLVSALVHQSNFLPAPDGKRPRHIGGRDYEKLRTCIDKLAHIGIGFDQAYENNLGWATKQITILKSVKLFNRKDSMGHGGKYFEFSQLELNEDICQNIKDKKIKLFYLDELAAIKGETGRLIYDRLELLGGVIVSPFRRDALQFAKECTIDIGITPKVVIRKMRRACKELKKRVLTSGVISDCYVETNSQSRKWFFVCHIEKVVTTRPKATQNGTLHVVPDRRDLNYSTDGVKDQELLNLYAELPSEEQNKINMRTREIHLERFHGLGSGGFAKQEALREYFGLEALSEEVKGLVAREREHVAYIGKYQRAALTELVVALSRYCALKQDSTLNCLYPLE